MNNLKLLLMSILFSSQIFSMKISQESLNQKLIQAIQNKDLEKIQAVIKTDDVDINARDNCGNTALIYATVYHSEIAKYLLNYCQSNNIKLNINARDNCGNTALIHATVRQPKTIKYLLNYCQSNNIKLNVNARDNCGNTALIHATVHQSEIVKCLIDYCQSNNIKLDVNAKDNSGNTALMFAIIHKPKVIKYLALAGADLNQIKYSYPTQYQNTLEEISKWILKNYPNDRNKVLSKIKFIALSKALKLIKDSNGNSLLHYAAIKEDVQLFGSVYSICPSLIAGPNNNNQTPLQLSLGSSEIFKLLQKFAF